MAGRCGIYHDGEIGAGPSGRIPLSFLRLRKSKEYLVSGEHGGCQREGNPLGGRHGKPDSWGAHKDLPDEVVAEILRIYLTNISSFGEITPGAKILNRESIAAMDVPESRYHPAAARFYKDNGVKMTSLQALGIID